MIEIFEKQRKTNPCQLANDRHKLIKTQARRFALVLLSGFILSTFTPVSVAQIQDHSRLILPEGAIARLGKGGVTYRNRGIAFSPDGKILAGTDVNVVKRSRREVVKLHDVETGQLLNTFTPTPPVARISSVSF